MKLTCSTLITSILLAIPANAHRAHVYLSDHDTASSAPRREVVQPSTARLILAQRLGLSDFHSLHDAGESTLASLNAYGGRQRGLFEDEGSRQPRAIVLVEGVKDLEDVSSKANCDHRSFLAVEDPPPPPQNKRLLVDLHKQNQNLEAKCETKGTALKIKHEDQELPSLEGCELRESCGLSTYLCKAKALHHDHASLTLKTLDRLHAEAARHDIDLTAIFMPPAPKPATGLFRRAAPLSTWGAYALPPRSASPQEPQGEDEPAPEPDPESDAPPPRPVLSGILDDITDAGGSDEEPEAPPPRPSPPARPVLSGLLDDITDAGGSEEEPKAPPARPAQAPRPPTAAQEPSDPPTGILPACYTSRPDCDSATHGCSGHGACALRYSYPEGAGSSSNITCFACACEAEVGENAAGQRVTTRWAGPACQKQDVSVPFWLLGGFSVVLVSVVTWAIGLLYGMGAEELPSVIGAGVAGPRPK